MVMNVAVADDAVPRNPAGSRGQASSPWRNARWLPRRSWSPWSRRSAHRTDLVRPLMSGSDRAHPAVSPRTTWTESRARPRRFGRV